MARKKYFTDSQGELRFLSIHDLGKRYRVCINSYNSIFTFFLFDTKLKKRLYHEPPFCVSHEVMHEISAELNNHYEDDLNYLNEIKKYTLPNDNQSNNYRSR